MPEVAVYQKNSVIYFRGDVATKVFVLKSGRVNLYHIDVETGGEEMQEVGAGEFFGVKSAIGKFPREENAIVVQAARVLVFRDQEFLNFIASNNTLSMRMLRAFSTQLREIHAKVRHLLNVEGQQTDSEKGLYQLSVYYHSNAFHARTIAVCEVYLREYPGGVYIDEVTKVLADSQEQLGKIKEKVSTAINLGLDEPSSDASPADTTSGRFETARLLAGEKKYAEALQLFQAIAESPKRPEGIEIEIARCLFHMGKYQRVIADLTKLMRTIEDVATIHSSLFYIASSYSRMKRHDNASRIFQKLLGEPALNRELRKKVSHEITLLEDVGR